MAKVHRLISGVLRLLTAAAAGAAAVLMVTSHETTSLLGFELEAKYSDMPPFIFFVAACALACAYSGLLAVLFAAPALTTSAARPVAMMMTDVMIGMVLTGAVAAAGAVAEVGRNGNSRAGWLPICGQVHGYCTHVTAALVAGFAALVVHFLAVTYELHAMA